MKLIKVFPLILKAQESQPLWGVDGDGSFLDLCFLLARWENPLWKAEG